MNWTDLVKHVADATGHPQQTVRDVLATCADEVQEALVRDDRVRFAGLGTFEPRWHKERVVRDIGSGRRTAIDGRRIVRFRPSTGLKDALASTAARDLRDPDHQSAWRLAEALIGDIDLYHAARTPDDLRSTHDDLEVERICTHALGDAWRRARETYSERVAPGVHDRRDYLADVARKRWCAGGHR